MICCWCSGDDGGVDSVAAAVGGGVWAACGSVGAVVGRGVSADVDGRES